MKANLIAKEKGDAKITIAFTSEEFEQAQIDTYKKEKDKYEVDGFRKGKAPRSIIEKRYGNFDERISEYNPDSLIIEIFCIPPGVFHFVTPLSSSSTWS